MMRKLTAIALVLCLSLTLSACKTEGTKKQSGDQKAKQTSEKSGGEGIKVDEKLINVDVTLPASYFKDQTEAEIQENAKEQGIKKATVNADGSVTYTMSKAKHREMLASFKAGIEETIDGMLNGKDAIESFTEITFDDKMTKFTVKVDASKYSAFDSLTALGFYLAGIMYQAFDGVPPERNHVVVEFVDAKTGKVLETADSNNLKE